MPGACPLQLLNGVNVTVVDPFGCCAYARAAALFPTTGALSPGAQGTIGTRSDHPAGMHRASEAAAGMAACRPRDRAAKHGAGYTDQTV
ncbi:hypothetical protein EES41_01670 [Streptomyces sp. ADI95-16]|nr:hypothetical protein EES41_01670 [Streptomyces sp. ADI95-16]